MGTKLRSISQAVNVVIDKTGFARRYVCEFGDLGTLEYEWPSNPMYQPVDDGPASDFGIHRSLGGT